MISLLLCGCGGRSAEAEESFLSWRESFTQREEHGITANVRFSTRDTVSEYTLQYIRNPQEETVEVLSPELIANVKAHLEDETPRLSFDGVILEAGSGTNGLSPMTALPLMSDFLTEGHHEGSWTEKKDGGSLVVTELEMNDGSRLTLWQNSEDMTPLYGEIRAADNAELYIEIEQFS